MRPAVAEQLGARVSSTSIQSAPSSSGRGRESDLRSRMGRLIATVSAVGALALPAVTGLACSGVGETGTENTGKAVSALSEDYELPVTLTVVSSQDDANHSFLPSDIHPSQNNPGLFELTYSSSCETGCTLPQLAQGYDVFKILIDANGNPMGSPIPVINAQHLDDDYAFQTHPDGKARFISSELIQGLAQECDVNAVGVVNCANNIDVYGVLTLGYVNGKVAIVNDGSTFPSVNYPYTAPSISTPIANWTALTTCAENTPNYSFTGIYFTSSNGMPGDFVAGVYDFSKVNGKRYIKIMPFDGTDTCSGPESSLVNTVDPTKIKVLGDSGNPVRLAGLGQFWAERDPNNPGRFVIRFAKVKTGGNGTGGSGGSTGSTTSSTSSTSSSTTSSSSTGGLGGMGGVGGVPGGNGGVAGNMGGMAGAPGGSGGTGGAAGETTGGGGVGGVTTTGFKCPAEMDKSSNGCQLECDAQNETIVISMDGLAACNVDYQPAGYNVKKPIVLFNESKETSFVTLDGNTLMADRSVRWSFPNSSPNSVEMSVLYNADNGSVLTITDINNGASNYDGNPNANAEHLMLHASTGDTLVEVDGVPLDCVGTDGVLTGPDSVSLNLTTADCMDITIKLPFECPATVLTPEACTITSCTGNGEIWGTVNQDKGTCKTLYWPTGYGEGTTIDLDFAETQTMEQLAGMLTAIKANPKTAQFKLTANEVFTGKFLSAEVNDGAKGPKVSIILQGSGGLALSPTGTDHFANVILDATGTNVPAYHAGVKKGFAKLTTTSSSGIKTPVSCVDFGKGAGVIPAENDVFVTNGTTVECLSRKSFATGGGGCVCTTSPYDAPSGVPIALGFGLVAATVLRRRRR